MTTLTDAAVTLVVDDIASFDPWQVRGVEIRWHDRDL